MLRLLERDLLVGFVIAVWPLVARAEVTFLGPTPYLSVADSPFDMSGLGMTFFLEDFEDGTFDLPLGATSVSFEVRPPSPTTDSVDADDGVIDGSGTKGHSLHPLTVIVEPTGTPRWNQYFVVSFDSNELGFSPNAFGLVVTDGVAQSHPTRVNFLRLFVKENDGTTTASPILNAADFLDDSDTGETTEDRFFGLRATTAVAEVSIVMSTVSDTFIDQFEIDHVQFGYFVPEPMTYSKVIGMVCLVAAGVRRGRTTSYFTGGVSYHENHESRASGARTVFHSYSESGASPSRLFCPKWMLSFKDVLEFSTYPEGELKCRIGSFLRPNRK